jgi:hypothetical protein
MKDNNRKSKGIKYKPKSFEEDLEHNSEEYDENKIKNTFIYPKDPVNSFDVAGSEYDTSDSESSSEVPTLVIRKKVKSKSIEI